MLRPWKINIRLDPKAGKAIYLQIADAIISDIQAGRLKGGTALPGSRVLAATLKVNRNTIVDALDVLLIEGWLVSRERKGTFVADTLPKLRGAKTIAGGTASKEQPVPRYGIRFDDGHPSSKIAPVTELARAYRQIFQQKARWQMMAYGEPFGDPMFREQIATMLNHNRAMQVDANDLCITRGSQMAMYLAAQCLLKKGDHVLIENPGYQPAWKTFENAGATLLPVRVDEEGLRIDDVAAYLKTHPNIKAIYTTPHHQYPTTVTLSLQRRLELIKLSNEHGFTIIEDDYDNEFHFGYRPVHPLASYAELRNYVYVGTLSKVVAPALRIGYLVTRDRDLLTRIGDLRRIIDVQGDNIMEQAVLQLIKDGTVKRHIKKASLHYKSQRDLAAALLSKHLGNKATFTLPDGGLALWVVPRKTVSWSKISQSLKAKGVFLTTPESFSFGKPVNGVRLGYGVLSGEQLERGIEVLVGSL